MKVVSSLACFLLAKSFIPLLMLRISLLFLLHKKLFGRQLKE